MTQFRRASSQKRKGKQGPRYGKTDTTTQRRRMSPLNGKIVNTGMRHGRLRCR